MAPLFVVSDVHGYRDDLIDALTDAGLVDRDERWIGGDSSLWVLGDLLDRGPDGIGVIDLVMSLQSQEPERVHMLMGNHEALALGMARFPESRFAESWRINGGLASDQEALTGRHLDWLAGLPLVARVGKYLFLHSDTVGYLGWGSTPEKINRTVAGILSSPEDVDGHWDVWARLTDRFEFAGRRGASVARDMLGGLGGQRIVHGHTMIGMLSNRLSEEVTEPLAYADGQVLAIDGGRYDGGPVLVVRLE